MQWSSGKPFVHPALLDRLLLRRAALRFAAHRWAVLPGSSHPARGSGAVEPSVNTRRVATWWRRRAYPVLLVTGGSFDVLDVPAAVGLRALGAIRLRADVLGPEVADGRGPVAVGPTGRWMFFVRPGLPLRPELANRLDVVRHARGSWVPAAPSRLPEGVVRWAVSPGKVHWRPADATAVQASLVEAVEALGRHPARRRPARRVTVPRQHSTSRRAG
jgi:hypothetical protein